jgi:hypothetical protein
VTCDVYSASRRAFRHFEYLRRRGDPAGLKRLNQLTAALPRRPAEALIRLEYDTWQDL